MYIQQWCKSINCKWNVDLEHFRWLVFAYSTVTSNAIPVFSNSFERFQIFAGPKLTWLTLGISKLSLYWLQTAQLVTLNLNISFINDGFIEFIPL